MVFSDNLKIDLFVIFVALLSVLLMKHALAMMYWKKRGVPCPETSLFTGSLQDFFFGRKVLGDIYRDRYFEYKSKGYRYFGNMFSSKPTFTPIDLDIVKSILQNDFQHFHSHGAYSNEDADIFSGGLFNLDGAEWKVMRHKLAPAFTLGKLKMMHKILQANADLFVDVLDDVARKGPVDIKEVVSRFTTDNISSCAFGLDVKCLNDPDAEFRKFGSKVFEPSLSSFARTILPFILPHNWLKAVNFKLFPKELCDFFSKIVIDTIKYRENNKIVRHDFIQMLIEMKNTNDPAKKLTVNEIIAQCFIFFIAGFESSSNTTTFACYELAQNQHIQDELREEINRVLTNHNGELTYEAVGEMDLLDRVVSETLRLHPPALYITRKCMKNCKIPGEDLEIEEGVFVIIAASAIHHDPEFYPDPEIFNPERFTKENKKNRPQFAYLPWGEGPRICIGARFGAHQAKMGLASLIWNFKMTLNEKTKTPLAILKTGLVATVDGGVWINLEKISEN